MQLYRECRIPLLKKVSDLYVYLPIKRDLRIFVWLISIKIYSFFNQTYIYPYSKLYHIFPYNASPYKKNQIPLRIYSIFAKIPEINSLNCCRIDFGSIILTCPSKVDNHAPYRFWLYNFNLPFKGRQPCEKSFTYSDCRMYDIPTINAYRYYIPETFFCHIN